MMSMLRKDVYDECRAVSRAPTLEASVSTNRLLIFMNASLIKCVS